MIGRFDKASLPKRAQGPKSRALHFAARLCADCNGARTQQPDREFDRFKALVSVAMAQGRSPESIFHSPKYEIGSDAYLNIFRYFAKLLCCQVAESGGPRPLPLSEFAVGNEDRNPVFLHIDQDPMYGAYRELSGDDRFAGHGGLLVPMDAESMLPTGFQSTLSLGSIRYSFSVRYERAVGLELLTFHHEFWCKCRQAYLEALKKHNAGQ